jgi:endo-1,4-beta-D-glucanase Y
MKTIHFITVRFLCLSLVLLGLGFFWASGFAKRPMTDYVHKVFQAPLLAMAEQPSSQNQGHLPVAYGAKEHAQFLDQQLHESWAYYKTKFMTDQITHVVSNNYGGTISEGQSYALLKAFWMNEPKTFDGIWQWTKRNMMRSHDHLLGWKWSDGAPDWFGRNTQPRGLIESENATDADQDIAYALLLAGKKWKRPDYTQDGLAMTQDIWRLNVQQVNGRYYLLSGTWEGFSEGGVLTVNPSYFAPYVYQTFALYDKEHAAGWKQLANDIYDTLEACTRLTQPGLPPNWCAIETQSKPARAPESQKSEASKSDMAPKATEAKKVKMPSAEATPATIQTEKTASHPVSEKHIKDKAAGQPSQTGKSEQAAKEPPSVNNGAKTAVSKLPPMILSDLQGPGSQDFSYDAFRVYWRMAMDAKLSPPPGREKALSYLKRHPFLLQYWAKNHFSPEGFTAEGKPRDKKHSGFSAGPVLIVNHATHLNAKNTPLTREQARQEKRLYNQVLGKHYHRAGYWFNDYNDFLHSVIWLHLYALQLQ